MPFTTAGGTTSQEADSNGTLSSATAKSTGTVNAFSNGGSVTGVIGTGGSVVLDPGGSCCSLSTAAVVINSSATRGTIGWTPQMGTSCGAGCTGDATATDPIAFQVQDLLSGTVTTGTLFDVSSHLTGPGSWLWGNGIFALNAITFDFSISLNSPYTTQQGAATLQVRNGLITVASGTGIFAGLFPAIGTSGNFTVNFNSNFLLDYNLGSFNGDPVAVQFTLGDSGSACVTPADINATTTTPEPTTLALTGAAVLLLFGRRRRAI
jgi:hypothetical protein